MTKRLFGSFSARGELPVGPAASAVLSDSAPAARFRPIVAFELARVDPRWRGTACFFAYELGVQRYSSFQVEADGKLTYVGDYDECNLDAYEDGWAARDVQWKAPTVSLVSVDVPELDGDWAPNPAVVASCRGVFPEMQRECEYWGTLDMKLKSLGKGLSTDFFLGGEPKWNQPADVPHLDGEPMAFVGQLSSDLASGHMTGMLYLFYSPQDRLLVQVGQHD